MKKKGVESVSPADLRRRAERRLKRKGGPTSGMSVEDFRGLVHELEVHQMELEIQNEELREAQLELANARDLYVDLYELAPVGYLTLDRRRVIRQANLSCAGLLCVDRERLIGTQLSEWMDPEDRDACYLFLRETLETGAAQSCALRLRRADGSTFWAGLEGVAVREGDGDSTELRVTLSDISVRVEAEQVAEQARREKEETLALLDAVLDQMPAGVYVAESPSGKLIMENEEVEKLLGHTTFDTSSYEDYGRFGALHPDGTPYKPEEYPLARVVLHGESIRGEGMHYRRGDGTIIQLSFNAAPILGAQGETIAGIVVFQDVTVIREAEEGLRNLNEILEERVAERTAQLSESRERAQLRNESIPHKVWSVLSNGTGEYFNRRTLDYMGKTTEEMKRLRWMDVVHADDVDKAASEWADMARGDREGISELRIRRGADGEYRWHLVQAVPMHDADGKLVRWLGTCTDIHERKLTEEALEASRRSLREHGESLEHKNLALREILGQLELEKRQIREDVATNMRGSVFPILDRLTFSEGNRLYIDMLRKLLEDLAHPFGRKLSETAAGLTAREKEVCRMVHGGLSSKEVSELLGISLQTVEKHRKNIRKKLGLVDSGATLGTYLSQL
jgi:PAS domain S-box-containing protein